MKLSIIVWRICRRVSRGQNKNITHYNVDSEAKKLDIKESRNSAGYKKKKWYNLNKTIRQTKWHVNRNMERRSTAKYICKQLTDFAFRIPLAVILNFGGKCTKNIQGITTRSYCSQTWMQKNGLGLTNFILIKNL